MTSQQPTLWPSPTGEDIWLVMDVTSAQLLRDASRHIACRAIGTVAAHASQNDHLALPLLVSGAAGRLLLRRGLAVLSSQTPAPPPPPLIQQQQSECDAAFDALWQRGLWVTEGAKFGCTWMAYEGDPLRYHAAFAVAVAAQVWGCEAVSARELVSFSRVCAAANKAAVVALRGCDFVTLEWRG